MKKTRVVGYRRIRRCRSVRGWVVDQPQQGSNRPRAAELSIYVAVAVVAALPPLRADAV